MFSVRAAPNSVRPTPASWKLSQAPATYDWTLIVARSSATPPTVYSDLTVDAQDFPQTMVEYQLTFSPDGTQITATYLCPALPQAAIGQDEYWCLFRASTPSGSDPIDFVAGPFTVPF